MDKTAPRGSRGRCCVPCLARPLPPLHLRPLRRAAEPPVYTWPTPRPRNHAWPRQLWPRPRPPRTAWPRPAVPHTGASRAISPRTTYGRAAVAGCAVRASAPGAAPPVRAPPLPPAARHAPSAGHATRRTHSAAVTTHSGARPRSTAPYIRSPSRCLGTGASPAPPAALSVFCNPSQGTFRSPSSRCTCMASAPPAWRPPPCSPRRSVCLPRVPCPPRSGGPPRAR